MSLAALYKIGVIVGGGSVQFNQLVNSSIDPRVEIGLVRGGGALAAAFGAVRSRRPQASFTSTAIKRVLDALTLKGTYYSGTSTFYLAKKTLGGGYATGANHASITCPQALFVPRRLVAVQGQEASIDVDIFMISTAADTTPAIAYAGSATLPTLTAADQAYTLGPGSINGSAMGSLQSLEIDFGLTERVEGADGNIYPSFACIERQAPIIKVTTMDPTILNTILTGVAQGATASKIYLRKKSNEGANVADATAEHISFTVTAAGQYNPGALQQSDEGDTSLEVLWTPLDDGVTDVLALNTATAIS
jgi:hypothetical protein